MIQVNLLPDVKLEYIKSKRLKRSVFAICLMASGAVLVLFILLFLSVTVVQKQHLSNLEEDITSQTEELKAMPDLAKILTIQNQLNALPALHHEKPVTSRIFTYIQQLAPQEASIDTLTVNFDEHSMTVEGSAISLAAVNKFADTLKFTTYSLGKESSEWTAGSSYAVNDMVSRNGKYYVAITNHSANDDSAPGSGSQWKNNWQEAPKAFSEVVVSEFGVQDASSSNSKSAVYTITFKYAPEIFSSSNDAKLTVPNQITTRSITEKPTNIFNAPAPAPGGR